MPLLFLNSFDDALLVIRDPSMTGRTLEPIAINIIISQRKCSNIMVLIIVMSLLCDDAVCSFFFQFGAAFGTIIFRKYHSSGNGIAFAVHICHILAIKSTSSV